MNTLYTILLLETNILQTLIGTVILIKCTMLKSQKSKGSAHPRKLDIRWNRTRFHSVCLLIGSQQGHEGTTSNQSVEGISTVPQAVEG